MTLVLTPILLRFQVGDIDRIGNIVLAVHREAQYSVVKET